MPVALITGGGGNIGSKLTQHFRPLGWQVRRLDRRAEADGVIAADLSVWDGGWPQLFDGVDTVIHLAVNGSPDASYASVERLNVDMTMNVFEAAAGAGVTRVIFASSNWVMAGKRFAAGPLLPSDEVAPVNPYGVSKWVSERIAKSFAQKRGMSAICFRIGYCQGKREIGYVPLDSYAPEETPEIAAQTREFEADRRQLDALREKIRVNRW